MNVDANNCMRKYLLEVRRRKLPKKKKGSVQGLQDIKCMNCEYPDGELEKYLLIFKEGAGYRSILNCFAIAVSKGLQYGVPLEEFV